jgi:Xaa-Pro aminopeptidase
MTKAEFSQRSAALAGELPERSLNGILISALPNVRYLSGFTGSNALLLLADGQTTLFTDPRYEIQAAAECGGDVRVVRGSLYQAAIELAAKRKYHALGFEAGRITYNAYQFMQEKLALGMSLVPTEGLVEKLRAVKSASEMQAIRASVLTNSKAFDKAVGRIKPKMTESDLAAEIEHQMRRLGAEKPAFETIVASGPRTALPHAQPTYNVLSNNQLLLIDMGCAREGYASDMTRMLHLGNPGTKAKKLYKAVLEAQLGAIAAVRAGVKAGAVDASARRILKAHGFEKQFVHSTGHGLGLEIHESPRVGRKDQTVLKAGMAITIEPGAYVEGFGGVRIEDTILVTETGCEVLTPTAKDLICV